jgi:hypothetical protein
VLCAYVRIHWVDLDSQSFINSLNAKIPGPPRPLRTPPTHSIPAVGGCLACGGGPDGGHDLDVATQSRTIKDHSKAPSWSPQGGQQVLNTPLMEGRSVCDTI